MREKERRDMKRGKRKEKKEKKEKETEKTKPSARSTGFNECGENEGCSELCDQKTEEAHRVFSIAILGRDIALLERSS